MKSTSNSTGSIDEAFVAHRSSSSPEYRSWLMVKSQFNPVISEDRKKYQLAINLPGIKEKDIDVFIEGKQLIIEVNKKYDPFKVAHTNWDKCYGLLRRAFYLPDDVKITTFEQTFKGETLTVNLLKIEKHPEISEPFHENQKKPMIPELGPIELS